MRAIIGVRITTEVQDTLGSPKTVSDIAQDTAGVTIVSATAHGFSNGDVVVINMTDGMAQIDRQAVRVANKTNDDFEAEGLDITGYEAFGAGTVTKVTAFATLAAARNVTAPNPAPNKIDITTLIDFTKQYAYGLEDAPDGSIACLYNPGGTTEQLIKQATNTKADMVIRLTFADGRQAVFNSNVSGGSGFDIPQNDAATATVAFTPVKQIMNYEATV